MDNYPVTDAKKDYDCKVIPKDYQLLKKQIDHIRKNCITTQEIFLISSGEKFSQEVLVFISFRPNWNREYICRNLSNKVAEELIKSLGAKFHNYEFKLQRREFLKAKWVEYGYNTDAKSLVDEILN